MVCQKCGKDAGESKFCPECGAEIVANEEEIRKAEAEESTAVEENNAGTAKEKPSAAGEPAPEVSSVSESEAADTDAPAPKKKSKKALIIAVIAIVVLAAAAVTGALIYSKKKKEKEPEPEIINNLYFKENSVYYIDPEKEEPVLISDCFYKDVDDENSTILLWNAFGFIKNNSAVLFPKNVNKDATSFSLYYKTLNEKEETEFKLADDVKLFTVSKDENSVIYLDTYGDLYTHNFETRKKLMSDVGTFWVNDDCSLIMYLSEDGGLYTQQIDGEKQKVDSDVSSVSFVSDDFSTIIYLKETDLYIKKTDSEKLKIDSEVKTVLKAYDTGEVYYTKDDKNNTKKTLMDYVKDTEEQEKLDDSLVNSNRGGTATLNAYLRFWTREKLRETEIEQPEILFFYDGSSAEPINKSFAESYAVADDKAEIVFKSYDSVVFKEVTIDEIVNNVDKLIGIKAKYNRGSRIYGSDYKACEFFKDFEKMVTGAYESDKTDYVAVGKNAILIESENGRDFSISDSGNTVCYIDSIKSEDKNGDLHMITIKDGVIETNEVYDTEVSNEKILGVSDDLLIYGKDAKETTYDLYSNKVNLGYDVFGFTVSDDKKSIYFYTEYEEKESTYTVNCFRDGNKTVLAEKVYNMMEIDDDTILCYRDYSNKSYKGDLYRYSKGESTLIDFDVSKVFRISNKTKIHMLESFDDLLSEVEFAIDWDV